MRDHGWEEEGIKTQTNQEQKLSHWWTLCSIYKNILSVLFFLFFQTDSQMAGFVASQDRWRPKMLAIPHVQRLWLRLKSFSALWFITADQSVMSARHWAHSSPQALQLRPVGIIEFRWEKNPTCHAGWSRSFGTRSAHIGLGDARSAPACEELKCDCALMKHDSLAIGKALQPRLQSLEFSPSGRKWIWVLVEAPCCFFLFSFHSF